MLDQERPPTKAPGNKLATEDQKGKRHSITERKIRLKEHKT
jgi:hypothetical protein